MAGAAGAVGGSLARKGKVTGGVRYSGLSIKYTCSEAVKQYKQFVWLTKIQFAFGETAHSDDPMTPNAVSG